MRHLSRPGSSRWRLSGVVLLLVTVMGCSETNPPPADGATQGAAPAAPNATATSPPGFLDPAPPPPSSDTLILSGGTLLDPLLLPDHPEGLFDAVVVVREGLLIGVGKRGEVDVPNDSRGIDASGHVLVAAPGAPLALGADAAIQMYRGLPTAEGATVIAELRDGRWERVVPADD